MLWTLFFLFAALVIIPDPVEGAPSPLDDIIYGIFDVAALLTGIRRREKVAAPAEKAALIRPDKNKTPPP